MNVLFFLDGCGVQAGPPLRHGGASRLAAPQPFPRRRAAPRRPLPLRAVGLACRAPERMELTGRVPREAQPMAKCTRQSAARAVQTPLRMGGREGSRGADATAEAAGQPLS